MKRNIFLLFLMLPMFGMAQVDGDYRSFTTGNWNTPATWQVRTGGVWATATLVPAANNNVYIQSGHTITLNTSVSSNDGLCNDIHINILGILAISGINNVNVSGKIRAYTGIAEVSAVDGTYTGTSSTTPSGITTSSTGVLKFVGVSRNITNAGEWNSTGITANAEFALNAGATGILSTGIKFKRITITACTITTSTFIAVGTAATDFIRLTSGARLVSSRSGAASSLIGGSGTAKCGIVQIDEGAVLELTGATPTMDCTTFTNNGTVLYGRSGAQTLLAPSTAALDGPVTLPNYYNLIIAGSSAKTVPPGLAINVSNSLSLGGASTAILANGGGSSLTYSAGATFVDSSTANIGITSASLEWPATNGPSNVRVVSNTLSFTAGAAVSRVIAGSLTLNGGNFTINSTNTLTFANGAAIIRSATGTLNINSGTLFHGVLSTDLVNVTINFNCTNSAEISSSIAPGKIGTLTIASGVSYTNTGGRAVTNLVNNGVLVLTPATTLTLSIAGTISGPGTITSNLSTGNAINYYSSSLSFTGSTAVGSLLMTPGLNTVRNFILNNSGGLSLGNAIKVDTTLTLTTGTLTTGGNLTLGNGTTIVRTAGTISAAPVFGTSVNVTYNDVSATTAGSELPASSTILNNLTINNSNGVLLTSSPAVNGTLTLSSGALSIGANTLTLYGVVTTTSGTISGSSTSNLVIGGVAGTLNFTGGSASLNNLTLNNAGTITLGTALDVYGTLTSTSGQLDLAASNLTLRSTAASTARFAPTALITPFLYSGAGKIIVERYISNIGRKWRLLSARSTVTTQNIFDSWQEGAGAIVNNLGTWITAPGGGNGFDGSSANTSILKHNPVTPAWVAVAATNTGAITDEQGYMLFVRGDRNDNPGNASNAPTVLRTAGQLRVGTQAAVTVSASGAGRTLVGNPFASPINMETIFTGTANLDQNMYVWDPTLAGNFGVGGFRSVVRTGVNTYYQTPVVLVDTVFNDPTIQFIHSGQAFFVKATGSDANVVFTESMKAVSPTTVYNPIVATTGDQQLIANLMVVNNAGNSALLADGIRVRFNDAYQAGTADDIEKMGNFGENISSYRNGKKLIVEQRPMIAATDTIFLRITNTVVKDYRLQIGTLDFVQTDVTAFLQDIYLNTITPLDIAGKINEIDFSVTTDAASANPDRFRIIFKGQKSSPMIFTHVKATPQGSNVLVAWEVNNQADIKQYELERSAEGLNFIKMFTQTANANSGMYKWLDNKPFDVNNFYRIRSIANGGEEKISEIVNVKIVKGNPGISCYPNPAVNGIISLQFTDMEKGNYQLRLVSTAGRLMFKQNIYHTGGNTLQALKPVGNIASGNYMLDIIKPDNSHIHTAVVIIN